MTQHQRFFRKRNYVSLWVNRLWGRMLILHFWKFGYLVSTHWVPPQVKL